MQKHESAFYEDVMNETHYSKLFLQWVVGLSNLSASFSAGSAPWKWKLNLEEADSWFVMKIKRIRMADQVKKMVYKSSTWHFLYNRTALIGEIIPYLFVCLIDGLIMQMQTNYFLFYDHEPLSGKCVPQGSFQLIFLQNGFIFKSLSINCWTFDIGQL